MTVTYEKVLLFRGNADRYKQQHKAKFSPFLYAIEKMLNATQKAAEEYGSKSKEINMKYAAKDKEGFFEYSKSNSPMGEQDNFKFKEDQELKRDKEVRELLATTITLDCEPYIIPDLFDRLPKDIDFSWWNVLSPFVLPELTPEIEAKLFALQEEREKKK